MTRFSARALIYFRYLKGECLSDTVHLLGTGRNFFFEEQDNVQSKVLISILKRTYNGLVLPGSFMNLPG